MFMKFAPNPRAFALLCAGGILSLLAGCGGGGGVSSQSRAALPTAVKSALDSGTPVSGSAVTADNSLGFALFGQLSGPDAGKNIFVSPTSIALALDMTSNGAAGATQQGITQALQESGIGIDTLNNNAAALQASLVNPDPNVTLAIANSAWLKDGVQFKQSFLTADQTYYGAQIGSVAGAPQNVNDWVSQQTHGLITSILPGGDYRKTIFILVNTVYFKGPWTSPFATSATKSAPFTLADGSQKTCSLMSQTGSVSYYQGTSFQLVSLPYASGRFSMVILLPASGTSLDTLVAGLNSTTWKGWLGNMQTAYGAVLLPKFSSQYSADLSNSLKALGMQIAFEPANADFSNIAPVSPLYISKVVHGTDIQVDENGTQAAAATAVIGVGTAVGVDPPPLQFTMRMDHPFFYAIQDNKTGEMLFMGVMQDPTATGS